LNIKRQSVNAESQLWSTSLKDNVNSLLLHATILLF